MDARDNPDHGQRIYNGIAVANVPYVPRPINEEPVFPSLSGTENDSSNEH